MEIISIISIQHFAFRFEHLYLSLYSLSIDRLCMMCMLTSLVYVCYGISGAAAARLACAYRAAGLGACVRNARSILLSRRSSQRGRWPRRGGRRFRAPDPPSGAAAARLACASMRLPGVALASVTLALFYFASLLFGARAVAQVPPPHA